MKRRDNAFNMHHKYTNICGGLYIGKISRKEILAYTKSWNMRNDEFWVKILGGLEICRRHMNEGNVPAMSTARISSWAVFI